jgi:hypothetical protein
MKNEKGRRYNYDRTYSVIKVRGNVFARRESDGYTFCIWPWQAWQGNEDTTLQDIVNCAKEQDSDFQDRKE